MANYAFTAVMLTAFDQQLHEGRKPLLLPLIRVSFSRLSQCRLSIDG